MDNEWTHRGRRVNEKKETNDTTRGVSSNDDEVRSRETLSIPRCDAVLSGNREQL